MFFDRICPNSYGEKSLETIRFENLKNIREGKNDPSTLRNIEDLLGEESGEEDSHSSDSWDK